MRSSNSGTVSRGGGGSVTAEVFHVIPDLVIGIPVLVVGRPALVIGILALVVGYPRPSGSPSPP